MRRAARLGEGPTWDSARRRLIWVDILGKSLHGYDPADGTDRHHAFDQMIGAAVPARNGNLLLALQDGLYRYDEADRSLQLYASIEAERPRNRMNDGKCDPRGRFWAGTLNMAGEREAGSLYRVLPDGSVDRMETGVGLSNGMGWSPDGTEMYFIDTHQSTLYAYDFDLEAGTIRNRRVLLAFAENEGFPDGMTVDAEGRLWIAHWGGSRVSCRDPRTGAELDRIEVPALFVTSCAFGGQALDELYITTAMDEESGRDDPYGGSLFRIRPGVKGMAAASFGGF
ncbi:SMP-30/gluconolactonase/LRE family protein [Cohnella caldifontis]|uniref:SMP-30/gluconolactonase/LRE family protein n=1 Tax=Cohnella caldifontis TaxID=3027471 RepID=UPI0030D85601